MKRIVLAIVLMAAPAGPATAALRVVASTTDLAAIAKAVGGEAVEVHSITRAGADPHFVEVLPSHMVRVKKAAVYFRVGMDLDRWATAIIDGSRNASLIVVDCSRNIEPLNVPSGRVDASMGDLHPSGNPHYWLDPANGPIIAATIAEALTRADPGNAGAYTAGVERFRAELEQHRARWREAAAGLRGAEIVTFHDTWPYFSRAFGVEVAGFVEPLPGIEPSPSHTAALIALVRSKDIRVIGVEPYFSRRTPESIAGVTGARVIDMPPSVGGAPGADDYFSLFDVLIARLTAAVRTDAR